MHDFLYGVTWNVSRKNLFNWKTDDPTNYEEKVKTFFDRERFLKVLRESIIFQSKDDALTKVVLRQHQARAVDKVIERVHDYEQATRTYLAHAGQRQNPHHDNGCLPTLARRWRC